MGCRTGNTITMLAVGEPGTLGTLGDTILSRVGRTLSTVSFSTIHTLVVANTNRGSFITNTSVNRVDALAGTRNRTFNGGKGSIFLGLRGLPVPMVTTMGNFTLNNNYRVSVTYSVEVYSRGTIFNRPRINLKVAPNFNNARHLTEAINIKVTGRLVCATEGVGTPRTLHVNLMGTICPVRRLVPTTGGVTSVVTTGTPVTIHGYGGTVGRNLRASVTDTIRVRRGLFNSYFRARSRGCNVTFFLSHGGSGIGGPFVGGWLFEEGLG